MSFISLVEYDSSLEELKMLLIVKNPNLSRNVFRNITAALYGVDIFIVKHESDDNMKVANVLMRLK